MNVAMRPLRDAIGWRRGSRALRRGQDAYRRAMTMRMQCSAYILCSEKWSVLLIGDSLCAGIRGVPARETDDAHSRYGGEGMHVCTLICAYMRDPGIRVAMRSVRVRASSPLPPLLLLPLLLLLLLRGRFGFVEFGYGLIVIILCDMRKYTYACVRRRAYISLSASSGNFSVVARLRLASS